MSDYAAFLQEHVRICLLRQLADSAGYASNSAVLHDTLPGFGLSVSRDQVNTALHWLAEQDLVEVSELGSVLTATITNRGLDVAAGRAVVPGVRRPGPRR